MRMKDVRKQTGKIRKIERLEREVLKLDSRNQGVGGSESLEKKMNRIQKEIRKLSK